MRKLPYGKALLYLAVVECKIDFEQPSLVEYLQILNEYFPFISFDSPFTYVTECLNNLHNLPATIVKGTYNKTSLQKFLKETSLQNMHEFFTRPQFQDLLYDVDLRRKVDGMAINGFRHHEIELEIKEHIPEIDPVIVKTYLDCFANYSTMNYDEKRNFIIQSFEEEREKKVLLKCIEHKSRDMVRMFLGVAARTVNPIELINRSAQIVTLKTQEGLVADDEVKIQAYLKLGIKIAEVLDKFGAGNKDAAEALLSALSKKPEDIGVVTPRPKTIEELEDMYLENTKSPTP